MEAGRIGWRAGNIQRTPSAPLGQNATAQSGPHVAPTAREGTMRLALKLFLAFMLGNIVLAGIYGYLAVRREERLFQETVRDEAETVGPAMESMLVEAWSSRGLQGVQKLVEKVATKQGQQFRVRWVWFDAQPGSPDRPWASPQRLTTVAIEQHFTFEGSEPDGTPALHTYWPVHLQGDRRGGLEFSHPLTELRRNENDMLRRVGLLMGGMVVLSGLLVAVLGVRYVGRPLRQLIEKVRRVAAGDLQGPIELHSHDELSELASSLNGMCGQLSESQGKIREETAGRIAAIEQLRHADRLKTVGRMASGIAHELGTPLNVVSGRADLIESGKLGPAEVAQSAAAIKAEATRMTKIIRQLLDFARANTAHKAAVDLRLIVSQTVDLLRRVAERKNVQVRLRAGRRAGDCRSRRRADSTGPDQSHRQRGAGDAGRRRGRYCRSLPSDLAARVAQRKSTQVLRHRDPRRRHGHP